jgi:hydrogenase/urease accessory protein HupE
MTSRARVLAFVNVGWMAFVWTTRLRNDPDTTAVVLSVLCLGGALALLVVGLRRGPAVVAASIGIAHSVVWLVRGVQIALDTDRSVGFRVVHVILAIISISLGLALTRACMRSRSTAPQLTSTPL